jgi:hypothetical protein
MSGCVLEHFMGRRKSSHGGLMGAAVIPGREANYDVQLHI